MPLYTEKASNALASARSSSCGFTNSLAICRSSFGFSTCRPHAETKSLLVAFSCIPSLLISTSAHKSSDLQSPDLQNVRAFVSLKLKPLSSKKHETVNAHRKYLCWEGAQNVEARLFEKMSMSTVLKADSLISVMT